MNAAAPLILSELNSRAATRIGADDSSEVLVRIRDAFEMFDNQSTLLRTSFENLKKNLAETNKELNSKNHALAEKVEELQQMSVRLQCILEGIGDGVLVVNEALIVERCNPAAEHLLGAKRSEIENKPYASVMNGLGNQEALRAAIDKGRLCLHEERDQKTGRRLTVMASVSPIRTKSGAVIGAVEVLRDVTHVKLLEEKMHHQKRMAALGEMAASVAHEIRNPLGTIEGFARLLRQDLTRDGQKDSSRLASKIIEGAQNLNYVITNLLTFARPMSMQSESFESRVLFDSVSELLSGIAAQQKVKLSFQHEDVRLRGDVRQIRQVLVNLGRNSVEACRPGDGTVAFTCTLNENDAVLTVSDNGCGLPQEDIPRVFDPFFTKKVGGTGLGLALCHKIVSAHGGEITMNSSEGCGTAVKVVLPQIGDEK